jgi:hypothetical protein
MSRLKMRLKRESRVETAGLRSKSQFLRLINPLIFIVNLQTDFTRRLRNRFQVWDGRREGQ